MNVRLVGPDHEEWSGDRMSVCLSCVRSVLSRVQVHSQENRMTAQNLALVFVPSLFQELAMNTDMVRLTRELIIHHALVFQVRQFLP